MREVDHPRIAPGALRVALLQSYRGRRGRFAVALQRARDPGFLSIDEKCARGFIYDVTTGRFLMAPMPKMAT